MSETYDSRFLDDPEFQSLLVACLESLQRGEMIDRRALAKDFPSTPRKWNNSLMIRQCWNKSLPGSRTSIRRASASRSLNPRSTRSPAPRIAVGEDCVVEAVAWSHSGQQQLAATNNGNIYCFGSPEMPDLFRGTNQSQEAEQTYERH